MLLQFTTLDSTAIFIESSAISVVEEMVDGGSIVHLINGTNFEIQEVAQEIYLEISLNSKQELFSSLVD